MSSQPQKSNRQLWSIIFSSSAGTLIEWYDFYIFGSLAVVLSAQFFPKGNSVVSLLLTLATFATGFVVRPFGALFFGRIGDLMGRKFTFLLTLVMMGFSTFLIGLVPGYETIGVFAPFLVLLLRLVQGLAPGGEYGGAATYVAEHAPEGRRGFYTSFIQTTATLGFFVSLIVLLLTRSNMSEGDFNQWGWRIPFLLSGILVIFSYFIRRQMEESPLFSKLKAEGKTSANPIKESFANPVNRRMVLIALFGATAGQGVVWYTGQFYSNTWLQTTMHLPLKTTSILISIALVFATPFFIFFGHLSDKIGRKKLMMVGCLLAALLYLPIFKAMASVIPQPGDTVPSGAISEIVRVTDPVTKKTTTTKTETWTLDGSEVKKKTPLNDDSTPIAGQKPTLQVEPTKDAFWKLVGLVFVQVFLVTMVYGPIAAFLVELFPTSIRYTSMSVPYHIGNGVFGGLVPFVATWLADLTKDKFAGLYYPIGVALLTFVIGSLFIKESPTAQAD